MNISAEFSVGRPSGRRRDSDSPMRILILGNWLGDRPAGSALAERKPLRIDFDNFTSVMTRLEPAVELPDYGTIGFSSIEDFHPDTLCRRVDTLRQLHTLYRNLGDPARARELIAELDRPEVESASSDGDDASATDLERLLGGKVDQDDTPSAQSQVQKLLSGLVAEHVVDTRAIEPYRQATAARLGDHLRAILHDPRFQALEANWRGLWWLVSQLIAEEIELFLLPLTTEELKTDLTNAGSDLARSDLCRLLMNGAAGQPWSVLAGLYEFGPDMGDLEVLMATGILAEAAGAPFVAAAAPQLAGCDRIEDLINPADWAKPDDEMAAGWQTLRKSEPGDWISLGLPRLMMRQPYGSKLDPIDGFAFEENPQGPEQLLWASPAFGLATALGLNFLTHGQDLDTALPVELEDLPTFSHSVDGEVELQAATAVVLPDHAASALTRLGLCPLMGSRNRTEVRLPACVAVSGRALSGSWGR
jgi:type VI secretion system protein ImpC